MPFIFDGRLTFISAWAFPHYVLYKVTHFSNSSNYLIRVEGREWSLPKNSDCLFFFVHFVGYGGKFLDIFACRIFLFVGAIHAHIMWKFSVAPGWCTTYLQEGVNFARLARECREELSFGRKGREPKLGQEAAKPYCSVYVAEAQYP